MCVVLPMSGPFGLCGDLLGGAVGDGMSARRGEVFCNGYALIAAFYVVFAMPLAASGRADRRAFLLHCVLGGVCRGLSSGALGCCVPAGSADVFCDGQALPTSFFECCAVHF